MDADACAGEPCGQDVQCYDLPAPASQFEGYTCGECPEGSVLRDIDGTCQGLFVSIPGVHQKFTTERVNLDITYCLKP